MSTKTKLPHIGTEKQKAMRLDSSFLAQPSLTLTKSASKPERNKALQS